MNEADMKNCVNVLLGKYREYTEGEGMAGLSDVVTDFQLQAEFKLWRFKCKGLVSAAANNTVSNADLSSVSEALELCDASFYPLVHKLLTILMTLPVSTASAERSFSVVRRLKTWLRTNMFQLSQRDRAAGCISFRQHWNWETIFYGHYRSIFNHCDIIGLKICRIP